MAHIRRKFFDVHQAQGSAVAAEALTRIAALHAFEEQIRGQAPERRAAVRQDQARPVLNDLEHWLHAQLPRLSAKTPLADPVLPRPAPIQRAIRATTAPTKLTRSPGASPISRPRRPPLT